MPIEVEGERLGAGAARRRADIEVVLDAAVVRAEVQFVYSRPLVTSRPSQRTIAAEPPPSSAWISLTCACAPMLSSVPVRRSVEAVLIEAAREHRPARQVHAGEVRAEHQREVHGRAATRSGADRR